MLERIVDALAARFDGWQNTVLAIGGRKDPSIYTGFVIDPPLDRALLESLYAGDHFAARIVNAPVRAGLRPGWTLTVAGDPAVAADLRDRYAVREDELGVAEALAEGGAYSRLFGGALTWIGADDGRSASQPLDETRVRTVVFVETFAPGDVSVRLRYSDPASAKYGKPELYEITRRSDSGMLSTAVVHESRCVRWSGELTTPDRRRKNNGWDASVLQKCWEPLRQCSEDYAAKTSLLGRISQPVYKIAKLYEMIAGGGKMKEALQLRIQMMDETRNRARAIVLDEKEDFLNIAQPMGGIGESLNSGVLRLAAAAEMPVTVLMGQSPAGLDATGEGDLELWFSSVDEWRKLVLRKRHEQITRAILLAQDGPLGGVEPDKWEIEYLPLRMPSAKTIAETRKLEAETYATYIDKGLVSPEELAVHVFSPSSRKTDFALDEGELKAKVERRRKLADQPPKDNAELGTVGARTSALLDVIGKAHAGTIPRESAIAILIKLHHYTPEDAADIMGPEDFVPTSSAPDAAPSAPQQGVGAGAPQGIPGLNAGGDPNAEQVP